jgi:DNA-binding beta-propeller fold protein YncE
MCAGRGVEVKVSGWLLAAALFAVLPSFGAQPLAQLPGTAGCISDSGSAGACVLGRELDGATGVAVSPDSLNVYVTSSVEAAVAVFDVDPGTGGLTQKAGQDGCVSESGSSLSCEDGRALLQAWAVAVSPDGRNVYVASFQSDAVLIFDRDPATGAIDQKLLLLGCISQDGTMLTCTDSAALDGAHDVAVTPDGRHVLVVGFNSNSLAVFERALDTGALTPMECFTEGGTEGCTSVVGLSGAAGVAVSPDGRNVYVASQASNAIARFDRDPVTGELKQPADATGCINEGGTDGCTDGEALNGAFDVAVSSNGRNVYAVARANNSITIFDRDPAAGDLAQAGGTDGCLSSTDGDCAAASPLGDPFGLAVSPDGESVYVAASLDSAVVVFDRKTNNGLLAQPPGAGGCLAESGGTCADGRGLAAPASIAVSADGRSAYVASFTSDAVAIFDRDVPSYDIDGDGQTEPLTDGLLLLRYLFGFTGATLVSGAVDVVNCTRCTAAVIEAYLGALIAN